MLYVYTFCVALYLLLVPAHTQGSLAPAREKMPLVVSCVLPSAQSISVSASRSSRGACAVCFFPAARPLPASLGLRGFGFLLAVGRRGSRAAYQVSRLSGWRLPPRSAWGKPHSLPPAGGNRFAKWESAKSRLSCSFLWKACASLGGFSLFSPPVPFSPAGGKGEAPSLRLPRGGDGSCSEALPALRLVSSHYSGKSSPIFPLCGSLRKL
jgi:hypothetical protein